ncbi:Bacterial extracellular solute-binding protein [Pseudovibrio sp. Ad13]|uniref:ABC transporter substrate-binding protein n=1 Tax=Pseudovibrio sp. Ad13 TaxID=989396 RepID=UPI0007AE8803|nr:extracellular solute-binding protein [Pseudovibrio sp. Ad13]KZK81244.1 Bacterial extracellular solute-binding protein [Pseudovibrio sp. Ad13]
MFGRNILRTTALVGTLAFAMSAAQAEALRFWTTEEQPARLAKQEAMAKAFTEKTGIEVNVIPVTEKDMGTRATAAYAAGDLPDVIYHPLIHVLPWAEAGIIDTDAATEVIEDLEESTFASGALNMAALPDGYAAVPVDGWTQMIVYRKDLFDAAGLEAPNTYASILAALEKLHNPPEQFGFVAATKIDESFMSQLLEHVLLANGATPVDENGFKGFDEKKLAEALTFYKALAKASPPGDLYWKQSRELYFAGKAAMIIWSPFILDELAGLRDSAPPTINGDPTSKELAGKTGVVTTLSGPSNKAGAAWGDIRYFSITNDADTEAAQQFVEYSMNDGYLATLSIAPEGKFPVRRGNAEDKEAFIKGWATLPVGVDRKAPLTELYPAETITQLVEGLDTASRWGVKEGQLSLASKILNSMAINRYTREFIDDELSAEEAVTKINQELAKIK